MFCLQDWQQHLVLLIYLKTEEKVVQGILLPRAFYFASAFTTRYMVHTIINYLFIDPFEPHHEKTCLGVSS